MCLAVSWNWVQKLESNDTHIHVQNNIFSTHIHGQEISKSQNLNLTNWENKVFE